MDTRTCPACGQPNPPRFVRCGRCGTQLGEDAPTGDIRRFVTVVTSDLKGSTALGERFDPETLRELLGLYFDEMRLVFESNGGRIEKIIGDAIVAVFGPTTDRVDDALRGLEAAAETQRALASLNDRLEATWGVRLVVRTGVASGDVFFGEAAEGQQVLTGPTMTIATAMEQHCPPLEVLVAASTVELVGDRAETEPLGPVTPKGTELVIESFRLVAVRERAAAEQAAAGTATPGANRCPACGEENPEGSTRCGMCGQTLTRSAVAHDTRKTVTIVFADPKPRTLDGSPPAPEALREVMPRYFDAMKEALEHHGGTVEKFIGDAVMAVYGLPVRHEDDAVRAVRAAAAMQAALPALNEDFRREWGLELRNHIGVNTGEVIAGDASLGQRLVTGDAVNTAARLEQAAGAQEVILGHLTYILARDQIEVEPIEPLTLKGKAEPVPAYRLTGVRQRPAERVAATTPFVGRAEEMERLRDALADAESANAARLMTIIGDAGVGKSRLVREFAGSLGDEVQVLRGRCLPYGDGITFWPIGEIVRSAAGIADEDNAAAALARIAMFVSTDKVTSATDAAAIAARVGAAISLSAAQFQLAELFWGIRKLFEAMARQRPLVAIVDDIQWAAPAFLELVDHLLEVASGAPMLVLATARHELLEEHGDWSESHGDRQIVLEPLSDADATQIIDRILDGLDESVRARIAHAAEGNPLYVEQITAMLVETGALRRDGDGWVTTSSSGDVAIPPTIQALVAARLDALSGEERAVIEPASVIGLSFARDAVQELLEEELQPGVPEQLTSLSSKQLVRMATGSDEEMYRFGHQVIKDTAYGGLLKRVRAVLHERFVQWADRVNAEHGRQEEFEEILGFHLEQAYRYRTELGPIDSAAREIAEGAAVRLARAGRRAFERGDLHAATSLLHRAQVLLQPKEVMRVEILADLADALLESGELARATAVAEDAAAIAREIDAQGLALRARVTRDALTLYAAEDTSGTIRSIVSNTQEAIAVFTTLNDEASLARAWRLIGLASSTEGRFEEAAASFERVVEHASRAGDTRLTCRAAAGYASMLGLGATPAVEVSERCARLLDQVAGDRRAEAVILGVVAVADAMQGAFDRARALAGRAKAILDELGDSIVAAATSLESSRIEMLAERPDNAVALLMDDDVKLEQAGEGYYRSTIVALLAHALDALGNVEDAVRYAELSRDLADEDDTESQILWRTGLAKALAGRGDTKEAADLVRAALELAATTDGVDLKGQAAADAATVLTMAGERAEAEVQWGHAFELFEQKGNVVALRLARARREGLMVAG